jgi:hypothetical protein
MCIHYLDNPMAPSHALIILNMGSCNLLPLRPPYLSLPSS